MALPKIDLPIREVILPSSKEKIKYRPFTVKEEKVLLVAAEAKDAVAEIVAIKQVVNNCVIDCDIDNMAMIDLEYIFLKLRASSVDNQTSFMITDPDTKEEVTLDVDVDEISLVEFDGHNKEIKINDELTLFLRYPTIDNFTKIVEMNPDDPLANYTIMVSCLDKLATEDEVHYFKDYKQEEIDSFMDGMSGEIVKKIGEFFDTMPKLRQEIKYTNSEGTEKTFVVEGMRSFFI